MISFQNGSGADWADKEADWADKEADWAEDGADGDVTDDVISSFPATFPASFAPGMTYWKRCAGRASKNSWARKKEGQAEGTVSRDACHTTGMPSGVEDWVGVSMRNSQEVKTRNGST